MIFASISLLGFGRHAFPMMNYQEANSGEQETIGFAKEVFGATQLYHPEHDHEQSPNPFLAGKTTT